MIENEEQWPPANAEVVDTKWPPDNAEVVTEVIAPDEQGSIEDELNAPQAEVVKEEEPLTEPPYEVAEFINLQSQGKNTYGKGRRFWTWNGERTVEELKANGNVEEESYSEFNESEGGSGDRDASYAKELDYDRRYKENQATYEKALAKKKIDDDKYAETNMTEDDFALSEDEFVKSMNQKYAGKGLTFEVPTSFGDKVLVKFPGGEKEFTLNSSFNNSGWNAVQPGEFAEMKSFIDTQTDGPDKDMKAVDAMMRGRSKDMQHGTIEEQTKVYKDQVDRINKATNLDAKQKWDKISNLQKPAYSTIKFNADTEEYEFAIKPEFQKSIDDKFKPLLSDLTQDPDKYKKKTDFYNEVTKVRNEIISTDPVLNQQAVNVQRSLEPQFKTLAKEISSKYDMTDVNQVEAANEEFNKARKAMFNDALENNKVYRHIVEDIDKAITKSTGDVDLQRRKYNHEGIGWMFRSGDALKEYVDNSYLKYTPIGLVADELVDGAQAMTAGFGSQTGKAWNSTQISLAQAGIKDVQGIRDTYDAIRNSNPMIAVEERKGKPRKVYVFNNGVIDYERSNLKKPDMISQGKPIKRDFFGEPIHDNVQYDLKGKVINKPQSAFGGELGGRWMTLKEADDYQKARQDKFKEKIKGDVDELKAFEETLELIPAADFSDGTSFKDIVLTTANVLPQVAIGIGGTALAVPTGGSSLVASTMFMAMQEYGNNYWDTLETGLTEELGRPPTNEELIDALAEDKYSEQGTAAGWAAVSALLEQGTGIRGSKALGIIDDVAEGTNVTRRAIDKIAKKSGYNTVKDMFVKTGKNQFNDMLRDGGKLLLKSGKGGISEYMTEFGQELTGQAAVSQGLGGNAVDRLDFKSANEAGTGGGIVGFILPGVGGMYRGGKKAIRIASRKAAIGLDTKNAASYKQVDKFFNDASLALQKKYENGQITKQELQAEQTALAETRNASFKVPKQYSAAGRQESLDLLTERSRLENEIKNNDGVFVDAQKARVQEINSQLKNINNIEMAHSNAMKAVDRSNMPVNIVRAKDTNGVQEVLDEINPTGKGRKNSKAAKGKYGIHISKNPDTGKSTIILNEDLINKTGKWTTAQHEVLHEVLGTTLKNNPRSVFALENAVWNKLGSLDPNTFKNSNLRRRIDQYQKNRKLGKDIKAEETLTLFSEALASGDIKFDRTFFEKAGDLVRRVFQQVAPGSRFGKINFNSDEDVYKFMKDYNKSMRKGKFTRAQKNMIEQGATVSDKLLNQTDGTQEQATRQNMKDSLEEDFGVDDDLDIVEEVEDSDIESVEADLNDDADAFLATEEFRPIAQSLANQYRMNPKFNANKDILVDEILTGKRGVLDLIKTYMAKRDAGTLPIDPKTRRPITLGQFVNNRVGGIRQRSKQIAADVLGMQSDKVTKEKSSIPEGRQELESLRKQLNITEQDQAYKNVIDKVTRTFKGLLPSVSSKKLISTLEKEFRREIFDTVKNLMGKPGSQQYKDFLNNYGEAIYNKLTQRQVNKRFNEFAKPVLDKDGKQKRMGVGESQAVGARVKDSKAGNAVFTKAPYDAQAFEDFHLKPTKGRPASKQTALAEVISEILGFDATQEVLRNPKIRERRQK